MRTTINLRNITFCFAAVLVLVVWGYQSSAQHEHGNFLGHGVSPRPTKPKLLNSVAAKNMPSVARLDHKSAMRVKIEKALKSKTACAFVDCPLGDVIEFFQNNHKINIIIDKSAINESDIDIDEPIDFVIDNMSLRNILIHILEPLGLYFHIKNESLAITTASREQEELTTVVYDVRKLLAAGFNNSGLLAAIQSSRTYPTTSYENGQGMAIPLLGCIVVKQTYYGHKEIFDMLKQLERVVDRKVTKTTSK